MTGEGLEKSWRKTGEGPEKDRRRAGKGRRRTRIGLEKDKRNTGEGWETLMQYITKSKKKSYDKSVACNCMRNKMIMSHNLLLTDEVEGNN